MISRNFLLIVLVALFTGLGAGIGLLFGHPAIGAGIGFLLPCVWILVVFLFHMFFFASLGKLVGRLRERR